MNTIIVSGFFVGMIYGLLGVGLVVVYRGSRVISFCYAETGMLAAFFFVDIRFTEVNPGALLPVVHDNGLWLALPAALAIAAALGCLTELLVVRPLRHEPRIKPLVGTLAVGALFFTYASRKWGLDPRTASPLVTGEGVKIAGLQVSPTQILILIVSVVVLLFLWVLYRFTPFGLKLRAVAIDPYASGLVGINVNVTSASTWALAGGLAGLSAILISPLVAFDVAFMTVLSIRGLAAALVGGLTNAAGAFAAGIFIGIAEAVIAFKSPVSGITDVALALIILTLMVVRPGGLAGSEY